MGSTDFNTTIFIWTLISHSSCPDHPTRGLLIMIFAPFTDLKNLSKKSSKHRYRVDWLKKKSGQQLNLTVRLISFILRCEMFEVCHSVERTFVALGSLFGCILVKGLREFCWVKLCSTGKYKWSKPWKLCAFLYVYLTDPDCFTNTIIYCTRLPNCLPKSLCNIA